LFWSILKLHILTFVCSNAGGKKEKWWNEKIQRFLFTFHSARNLWTWNLNHWFLISYNDLMNSTLGAEMHPPSYLLNAYKKNTKLHFVIFLLYTITTSRSVHKISNVMFDGHKNKRQTFFLFQIKRNLKHTLFYVRFLFYSCWI